MTNTFKTYPLIKTCHADMKTCHTVKTCHTGKTCQYYLNKDAKNRHKGGKLYIKTWQEMNDNANYNAGCIVLDFLEDKILKYFDFKGYVIAGGLFSEDLVDNDSLRSDIDIFIYEDHETTLQKIIDICLSKDKHREVKIDKDKINRGNYVINLPFKYGSTSCNIFTIQIILRRYTTIAEILYGFDIGPGQVAYDGKQFYLTVMSKLAFNIGIMIADTTRRSTTYEARLQKYATLKGFDLILPFYKPVSPEFYCHGMPNKYFHMGPAEFTPVNVKGRKPDNEYDNRYQVNNISLTMRYCLGLSNRFCIPGININIKELLSYVNLSTLILAGRAKRNISYLPKAYQNALLEDLKQDIQIGYYNRDFSIKWIEENPGTQLTASINPIFEDPSEWYGDYYYPIWTTKTAQFRPDIPAFEIWLIAKIYYLPKDLFLFIVDLIDDHPAKTMDLVDIGSLITIGENHPGRLMFSRTYCKPFIPTSPYEENKKPRTKTMYTSSSDSGSDYSFNSGVLSSSDQW